jgi:Tfp pilus assembly protein PilF/predicted porin
VIQRKFVSGKNAALLVFAVLQFQIPAFAQEVCRDPAGRFASIEGRVQIRGDNQEAWRAAKQADRLCKGDSIRVGEKSRAAVVLVNEAVLRLDQNTTMRLVNISGKREDRSLIEMAQGAIKSFIRKPRLLQVNTPYLNGSVEGTEFQVSVAENAASILVLEGRILASNDQGKVTINPGEIAEAQAGAAPTSRLLVKPRDAVQWTLFYPPIQATSGDAPTNLEALDKVAESDRDAAWHINRASLLLSVGRQDEALASIDAAVKLDAKAGQAHALRSIIHTVRNERPQALAEAEKGVALTDNAATRIALSYAQQADFQLDAARDTLLVAVQKHPDDALAWARLSELELALGNRRNARAAAENAVRIEPDLGRTQSVLGFAALAEIRASEAQAAFERAIALESADPLAHLGLGLAQIRQGHMAEGRAGLETAIALDSNNALLRAYLGKAYFEEKRGPLDAQQLAVAKELDPLDPTAFFYDAIRLQTENRPVEALAELENSIERNDNRAVFRSRLLLDQDRAARGTSAARIYSDLGFTQLGINEATKAVTTDPASASAHRFLSDTYQSMPRHETARVSELQQAQMLQDVNINPIQPSQSDTNLGIVTQGGPAAGFNEFTPLFERNRAQANVSVFGGSNDTLGGEAVVSGVYDKFSLSAGAFLSDTDGFRPNNDLDQEVYSLFAQVALTPALNLQAEFQSRESEYGDLAMNFDPESYSATQRNKLETDTLRLGARLALAPNSNLLFLYNNKDADVAQYDESLIFEYPFPPPNQVFQTEDLATTAESDQYEGAWIYQAEKYNLLVGGALTKVDRTDTLNVFILDPLVPFPIPIFVDERIDSEVDDKRVYGYGNFTLPANLTWTLGLSYQKYEETAYDLSETNPKLGVQWQVDDTLKLRGAWFKAIKPALASNRTLEPTQIAGFNQYFDDVEGTRSTRYGVGADWQPAQALAFGAELSWRDLESPAFDPLGNIVFDDREEETHRAYAYWTPSDRWAVKAEAIYDKFDNDENSPVADVFPESVRTISLPVRATYFHPTGLFAGVGLTYVDQEVTRAPLSLLAQGDDSFTLVDLSVGYRLPKRMGSVSLSVHNLFDQDFMYQDDSYREFGDEPSMSPYTPERVIMGRINLSF